MKKPVRVFLKIIEGILISVILVLVLLFIFIHTESFNRWALDFTLDKLNESVSSKENKITAESLEGNILSEIRLNKGFINVKNDSLLYFDYLELKYDLWGLLNQEISVDKVVLHSPVINLTKIKGADSLIWNFSDLFTSSEEKDTAITEFDWDVSIKNLKIEKGLFRVFGNVNDTLTDWRRGIQPADSFDYNNLEIRDFEMSVSAEYFKDRKKLHIDYLTYNSNSDFNVKKLNLDAIINTNDSVTEISNMELITNKSDIVIDKLSLNNFNPFDTIIYANFQDKNVEANIDIKKFNFDDLKFFLPSLKILDSTVSVKLNASGNYGDLNVKELNVTLPNSVINVKGNIKNLQDPENMYFDVVAPDMQLDPKDVQIVYKAPLIPDYSALGVLQANLKYKGTFENFYSEYDLKSNAGNVLGSIDLNSEFETYEGVINTTNLNLGKILKNNDLNSSVNINLFFKGKGFDEGKISADIHYSMNNSRFAQYHIRNSSGEIHTSGKTANLNIVLNSSVVNAAVSGRVNYANTNNPLYSLKGRVSNLNLQNLTKDPANNSNLNFTFNINGSGTDIQNINGTYNFGFSNSFYADFKIPETPVSIEIKSPRQGGLVKLTTNFFEFNAEGKFTLASVMKVLESNVAAISNVVTEKFGRDTMQSIQNDFGSAVFVNDEVNLKYKLVIKDSSKFNEILNPAGIYFIGDLSGDLINNSSGFSAKGLINVNNFAYQDTAIILENVFTNFSFQNNYTRTPDTMSPYSLSLDTKAERVQYESNYLDSVFLNAEMTQSNLDMKFSGKRDTTISAKLNGNFRFEDNITANIDSIFVQYEGRKITNNNKWIIHYFLDDKVSFEQFAIRSKELVVNVKGDYAFEGSSDLKVESDNIHPSDIFDLMNSQGKTKATGDIDLTATYKGTSDAPELDVKINSNNLKFEDNSLGTLDIAMNYKDEVVNADLKLINPEKKGRLEITGNIPYPNPMKSDSDYVVLNNPVDLKFIADKFLLDDFAKLVPGLPQISGTMNGEITAAGTGLNPDLKGKLKVSEGLLFLELTGMQYKYDLAFSTTNSKLNLNKLSMTIPGDKKRHLDVFGSIDFAGMKINQIDLSTSGDMVFLNRSAKNNTLGIEGYVLGGVGNNPVKIRGDLKKLDITGQFLIKDANISSISTTSTGYNFTDDNFIYVDVPADSAGYIVGEIYLENPDDIYKINPFERDKFVFDDVSDSAGILNLDLNVKTEKKVTVSINITNIRIARLFGELNADINIKTQDNQIVAVGDLDVEDNSYFSFYRNFELKDSKIIFNGPIGNPQLDVQGVYEGTKSTEQFGNSSSTPVHVKVAVQGYADSPKVSIKLLEDGSEVIGDDAQADAITFLLFGRYKSELSTSERQSMATTVGTTLGSQYVGSLVSQTLRDVLPFITNTEFNYSEGNVKDTDVEVTSEFGEFTVKVGGKLLKEVKNIEFSIEYPLNKFLNLDLPESLIMQIAKEEQSNSGTANSQEVYGTGIKIAYKIKY